MSAADADVVDLLPELRARRLVTLPMNDEGNAERLVAEHGDDLRFVSGIGWVHWGAGVHWRRDEDGEVTRRMLATVQAMRETAAKAGSDGDALAKHAIASGQRGRIEGAITLAAANRKVVVKPDSLDAQPMLLGVANGTVDLTTGQLSEARREDLVSLASPVAFDAAAACPRWERFLAEVFAGDLELVAYLQRLIGYFLTGDTSEHVLPVLHGDGANGKSTLIAVLEQLLGDLFITAAFETFLVGRGGGTADYDLLMSSIWAR